MRIHPLYRLAARAHSARHVAMLDQPEKFRQVLTDFIDRI
jgi:hypothetical protein